MQESLIVRRETHIPAPPAAVFALLTDPEKILRWMGTEADVEAKPGGLYLVNVTGARVARGSFLIEQPDGTLLRMTHSGLPNSRECASHTEGWTHYLGRLAQAAAGHDPGPDPFYGRTG